MFLLVITFILIAIFFHIGKPISLHLLRYKAFAVKDHSNVITRSKATR